MTKKVKYLISIIILCTAITLPLYIHSHQYTLENEESSIETHLNDWINKENDYREVIPAIIDIFQIGDSNTNIVLFQTDDENMIGYASYLKGWNGKLKAVHYSFGTDKIYFEDIQTNKGKYGIILGMNPNLLIDHINVDLIDKDLHYVVEVSKEERFLKYKKLPKKMKDHVYAELILKDDNSNPLEYTEVFN
ncbi:hypothetical protein ACFSTA_17540 [Ornithinibacillus salinisoli]|uniref:DUF4825 domain-containing protein n=1 Tax=Ornithinibacillus salinisoli TaxID=1848459 RepID=A0ABW4W3X8_9BACI